MLKTTYRFSYLNIKMDINLSKELTSKLSQQNAQIGSFPPPHY